MAPHLTTIINKVREEKTNVLENIGDYDLNPRKLVEMSFRFDGPIPRLPQSASIFYDKTRDNHTPFNRIACQLQSDIYPPIDPIYMWFIPRFRQAFQDVWENNNNCMYPDPEKVWEIYHRILELF